MKQYFGAILRFFKAVFFTFGLLIFLFCVRRYLPGFNGSQGVGLVELRLCLAMAVVFSMAHTIITSDRVPIRISLIATGILSSITCGVLSVYSGIPSAIIRWFDITDTTVAILSWWAGFFICFVVLLFIYFVVERYANSKIEELDTHRQALTKEIAALSAEIMSPEQIERLSVYLNQWEEIDFEDRRQVADGLISQIRATDEHVSIEWKI